MGPGKEKGSGFRGKNGEREEALGTGKENFIGVGVGIGKRRFKGSKKVQTRLTALVQ
jgi:hypothetical protein